MAFAIIPFVPVSNAPSPIVVFESRIAKSNLDFADMPSNWTKTSFEFTVVAILNATEKITRLPTRYAELAIKDPFGTDISMVSSCILEFIAQK